MPAAGTHKTPVKLRPKYFSHIWGGTLLRDYLNKDIPSNHIGESWEVSAHPKGQSIVGSGPCAGMPLGEYAQGESFFGKAHVDRFPLLVKLIGAATDLSVQVHPGDDNCRPGEAGKAEAWVILACPEGAELIYGIKGSAKEFAEAVRSGVMEACLRRLAVKPGDVLDIPAGMVHALTSGIVVYEVQQNSDTTYRLHDWGRVDPATGKPRELHVDAALKVIRAFPDSGAVAGITTAEMNCVRTCYISNSHFTLEKLAVCGSFEDRGHPGFAAYTVIEGCGSIYKNNDKCFDVALGETFISPAAAGAVELDGKMVLMKSYVR